MKETSRATPITTRTTRAITTRLGAVAMWARRRSLWPVALGSGCCLLELEATFSGPYDVTGSGWHGLRYRPRQSDLLIVAGCISQKMLPVLLQAYDEMPEPKWVIWVGSCASSGGLFDTYSMVPRIDEFLPVHAYVPGCPPRPDALIAAIRKVQELVE